MSDKPLVVVAMSGGVDSSVSAALLVEQGYPVVGMMLRLWSEPGSENYNRCCTPDAMAQARRVAQHLGIPFYAIDVQDTFRQTVVETFLDGYARGVTPNPCWVCNRKIRWGTLYEQARAVGADYMATGHYARLRSNPGGTISLLKGLDEHKDQSYVLSGLDQEKLAHTFFPIGEYHKPEVRELARKFELPTAERPDSQDLCFLAGEDYRGFLARNAPEVVKPGLIVDRQGQALGKHDGLAFYTIGQRKGLGIAASAPLYVLEKRAGSNELVAGGADELGQDCLTAGDVHWIEGEPSDWPIDVTVKIRYKAMPMDGQIDLLPDGRVRVQFRQSLRDITPGQRAVFYQGNRCLGGGMILVS